MSILDSKRQLNKANSLTAIVIMAIIVLVLNIFSAQLFGRWDLTENNDYKISSATKDMLKNLKDVVNIKAYFTENLPGYLLESNRDVRDIIAEFETASHGNVLVTYLDPSKDTKVEEEARGVGIPVLQFNVVQKDQYQVTNGYLGVAVFYGDKKEIIPLVQNSSSLEYDLAAAISKLTRDKVPTVAWLAGKGAFRSDTELSEVNNLLQRQYNIRDFKIDGGDLVSNDIDALIIPNITEPLTKREQYVLDQYLMAGGNVLVMAEGTKILFDALSAAKAKNGMDELLGQWGVRLNKNLILDPSSELAGFRTDTAQFFAPYPLWVKIVKSGFNPESGIVNKLESLVLTWASSLDVLREKLTDKTTVTDLIHTTTQAWMQDDAFNLNPQRIQPPARPEDRKSFVMGTMLSGHFQSLFSKDTIPPKELPSEAGKPVKKSATTAVTKEDLDAFHGSTETGRLIVVGDADFPTNDNIKRFEGNAVLFQNLVDTLSSDDKLINIRSKAVTDRPIKDVSDNAKNAIKWLNILGVSVLFTGYGLIRFARRRKARVEI